MYVHTQFTQYAQFNYNIEAMKQHNGFLFLNLLSNMST